MTVLHLLLCLSLGIVAASAILGVLYAIGNYYEPSVDALDKLIVGAFVFFLVVLAGGLSLVLGCAIAHSLGI